MGSDFSPDGNPSFWHINTTTRFRVGHGKTSNDENALIIIELQFKKRDMYYKSCTLECVYLDKINN
jgi:hypothetical protein